LNPECHLYKATPLLTQRQHLRLYYKDEPDSDANQANPHTVYEKENFIEIGN